jgi:hypothetical protein
MKKPKFYDLTLRDKYQDVIFRDQGFGTPEIDRRERFLNQALLRIMKSLEEAGFLESKRDRKGKMWWSICLFRR